MRFALAATSLAAAAAIPFGVVVAGPNMTGEQFVGAVRCVAYQGVHGAEVGAAKSELNWEAHRQSPETVAEALDVVREIDDGAGRDGMICGSKPSGYEA